MHWADLADVAEAVGFLASTLAAAITAIWLTAGIPSLARAFSQSADYKK